MAGSVFTPKGFAATGDTFDNPVLDARLTEAAWAKTGWADLTADVKINDNGLVRADGGLAGSAVVKQVDIGMKAGTTQARFAYMDYVDGAPTAGQQIAGRGDQNKFYFDNVEISETRSPVMPVLSDRDQRLTGNLIKDARALADKNATSWCARQHAIDHFAALLRGANYSYLTTDVGGLGADVGGILSGDTPGTSAVGGSQALHEIVFTAAASIEETLNGASPTTAKYLRVLNSDSATARRDHEQGIATDLKALQGASVSADTSLTRESLMGMRHWAEEYDIRPVAGSDYDYVLIADSSLVEGLLIDYGNDSLLDILRLWAQGNKDQSGTNVMDRRIQNIVIDGVKIIPDRLLRAFRPSLITGVTTPTAANVVYGGSGTTVSTYAENKHRAWKSNVGNVGIAFLLGDAALIKAKDGGVKMMSKEGDFETGLSVGTREFRSLKRAAWKGKDANTTGGAGNLIQIGSMQGFFRVPTLGRVSG